MTFTTSTNSRRRRYAVVHSAAIMVSVASGTFALVAMLVGSPLSFGLALALCGTGWIVTHFVERLAEQDRRAARARREAFAYAGFTDEGFTHKDFEAIVRDDDNTDDDFTDDVLVDEAFVLEAGRHTRLAVSPLQVRRCEELQDRRILLV